MRLIDAGTVQVDFECAPYYKCNSGIMRQIASGLNRPCTFSEHETLLKWKDILDILDASPTIEAEPVRHATYDAGGGCTNCGYPMPTDDRFDAIFPDEIKYCYHCGAKMDKEEAP